jgi:hypothetical protein
VQVWCRLETFHCADTIISRQETVVRRAVHAVNWYCHRRDPCCLWYKCSSIGMCFRPSEIVGACWGFLAALFGFFDRLWDSQMFKVCGGLVLVKWCNTVQVVTLESKACRQFVMDMLLLGTKVYKSVHLEARCLLRNSHPGSEHLISLD